MSENNAELQNQIAALSAGQHFTAMPTAETADLAGPPGSGERAGATAISRRTIGVALAGAAAGAVGAAVLADRSARPTASADRAVLTAMERPAASGGIATAVITLADATRISVDAARGNDFRITLRGERIIANPVGGADGQRITFMITQGADSHFNVTWSSQYKFGAAGAPDLSVTPGSTDIIGFIYNESLGSWLCAGSALGF